MENEFSYNKCVFSLLLWLSIWGWFAFECHAWWWLGEEMHGVWSWGSKAKRKTKEDLEIRCPRGLSARKLNREDAMDHCKWRMIKDVRWSGCVWVGECFFWYRPTRVVPDKRPLNGRVCVPCWAPVPAEHLSILICSSSVSSVTAKSSAYSSSYVRATLNSLDMASVTITNKNGLNAGLGAYPLDIIWIVCFC